MILADFSIVPLGKGESLSRPVSAILKIIDGSGLDYRFHSMGTTVEGEWDEVFGLIKRCFEKMKKFSGRVSLTVKVDYRKGAKSRLESKIKSVETKLGKKLKT